MKTLFTVIMVVAVLLCTTATSFAADKEERTDKVAFDRLVREIREVNCRYSQAYNHGVAEARENNGKASLEAKAKIISLRDEKDRKMTRLLLIALRHNWDIPQFDSEDGESASQPTSQKEQIFAPVDDLIRTAFTEEAAQLAAKIQLPVVSISVAKETPKKNSLLAIFTPSSKKDD